MCAVSGRMKFLLEAGEDESKFPLGCWLTWRRKPKGTVACQRKRETMEEMYVAVSQVLYAW